VQLRFRDPMLAHMIRRHNITIWLDNKGKKDRYYRIRYNNGLSLEEVQRLAKSEVTQSDIRMPPRFMDQSDLEPIELNCYREGWRSPRSYALNASEKVAAAFDTSFSFFVYEFRVPLGDSLTAPDGIDRGDKNKWSLGIEMSELQMRMHGGTPDMGREMGPDRRGGGGRKGGMGEDMFGGRRSPTDGQFESEKTEFWFKFKLAESQK